MMQLATIDMLAPPDGGRGDRIMIVLRRRDQDGVDLLAEFRKSRRFSDPMIRPSPAGRMEFHRRGDKFGSMACLLGKLKSVLDGETR
jgi:hypothetical protein